MNVFAQWFQLLSEHPRKFLFALTHTFFSGYGQTYFLAFVITAIQDEFVASYTEMGLVTMFMSLGSGMTIPYVGRLLDRVHVGSYSLMVGFFAALACVFLASAKNLLGVFFGLYVLRLCAHGLLPHISDVAMSRYFSSNRGKALSLAGLGACLCEIVVSCFITKLLIAFTWRELFLLMSGSIVCIFLPVAAFMVQRDDEFHQAPNPDHEMESYENVSTMKLFSSLYFLSTLLLIMVPPFLVTAFLLYQKSLALSKGWPVEVMASFLTGFALCRSCFGMMAGILTDRYGARNMISFYALPLSLGFAMLVFVNHPVSALCCFTLAGGTLGFGSNFKAAVWSELYGRCYIAKVRSIVSSMVIFSTAISPPLVGYLLDHGYTFTFMLWAAIFMIWSTAALHFMVSRSRYALPVPASA